MTNTTTQVDICLDNNNEFAKKEFELIPLKNKFYEMAKVTGLDLTIDNTQLTLIKELTVDKCVEELTKFLKFIAEYTFYGSAEISKLVSDSRLLLEDLLKKRFKTNESTGTITHIKVLPLKVTNLKKSITNIVDYFKNKKVEHQIELVVLLELANKSIIPILDKLFVNEEFSDIKFGSHSRDILQEYFYGGKYKKAYFVLGDKNDDELQTKLEANRDEMKKLLKSVGFEISNADSFKNILDDFTYDHNYYDFVIYYSGKATVIDDKLVFSDKDKTHLDDFISNKKKISDDLHCYDFISKEKIVKEKNKGRLIEKENKSRLASGLKLEKPQKSKFASEFKKLFIFDIINDDSITDLIKQEKPTFPVFKDAIYLYSNLSSKINQIYDSNTTVFTHSLISRVIHDKNEGIGRNLSEISKVIQHDIINLLKVVRPLKKFDIPFDQKFKNEIKSLAINKKNQVTLEEEQKTVGELFGPPITELVFCKILFNCYQIIYGDASNGDFLIYDNFHIVGKE